MMGMAAAAAAAVTSLSLLLLLLFSSITAAPKGEAEALQGEASGLQNTTLVSQEGEASPHGGVEEDSGAPPGSISGPGYTCSPAFPSRQEVEGLKGREVEGQGLLLCNKTSSGPGFHFTEVARLAQTEVLHLQGGECETLGQAGFRSAAGKDESMILNTVIA